MDGFRADMLSRLATKATGKPCTVKIERLEGANGAAYYDGAQYVVVLHPVFFACDDVRGMAKLFWHECAHVALGHCRGKAACTEATIQIAREWVETPAGKAIEADADAWAAACMARIPAHDVWALSVDKRGRG